MRINKTDYYLDIANQVSKRSTCLSKHWGAIIVNNDIIISTGFNGAPRHVLSCMDKGECNLCKYRKKYNLGRGTAYEQCLSVHAEQNAIIFADADKMVNATLYLCGWEINSLDGTEQLVINPKPCSVCRKMILNAGIKNVIARTANNQYIEYNVSDWIKNNDITGTY